MSQRIDFTARDIFSDSNAKSDWEALNFGTVPVAVCDDRRLAIYHVDQLRDFLGLPPKKDANTYQELVTALKRILEAVERVVLQVPASHLSTPTPNRGRDLRELVFNIHHPINLMRKSYDTNRFNWSDTDDFQQSRQFNTPKKLAEFCRNTRLRWLERSISTESGEPDLIIRTNRGNLSRIQLLEAQAQHAAQHLRQIYVFSRAIGLTPEQELSAEKMRPIVLGKQVL